MKSYRFIISGRVQGVFYRANVAKNAQKAGFNGYVKNLENKEVEAAVTAKEKDIDRFIAILKKGSALSRVDEIQQFSTQEVFDNGFEIRYE